MLPSQHLLKILLKYFITILFCHFSSLAAICIFLGFTNEIIDEELAFSELMNLTAWIAFYFVFEIFLECYKRCINPAYWDARPEGDQIHEISLYAKNMLQSLLISAHSRIPCNWVPN